MADEGGGAFDDLERWAAEARAREAAEARVRERWLRTQAEEDARLSQVLAGLAERGADVIVTTTAGRAVPGRFAGLGQDFVAVRGPGRTTLVPLASVAWVRPASTERRRRSGVGLGPDPVGLGDGDDVGLSRSAALADVLAHAVVDRPRVALQAQGAALAGELRAVGLDVLVVETSGEPLGLTYVRLQSLSEISLLASG